MVLKHFFDCLVVCIQQINGIIERDMFFHGELLNCRQPILGAGIQVVCALDRIGQAASVVEAEIDAVMEVIAEFSYAHMGREHWSCADSSSLQRRNCFCIASHKRRQFKFAKAALPLYRH